jgi:hypothetical protein
MCANGPRGLRGLCAVLAASPARWVLYALTGAALGMQFVYSLGAACGAAAREVPWLDATSRQALLGVGTRPVVSLVALCAGLAGAILAVLWARQAERPRTARGAAKERPDGST